MDLALPPLRLHRRLRIHLLLKPETGDLKPEKRQTAGSAKEDLRHRTKAFAADIIELFTAIDRSRDEVRIIGTQMLRSGTSVAAQYREASRARSPSEFISKIECCTQEADETQLWLELLTEKCSVPPNKTSPLIKETNELISIFVTMSKRTKANIQTKQ